MKWLAGRWRLVAWPIALLLVGVAVTVAAKNPGDMSYWVSVALVVPAGVLGIMEMEQRWPQMSRFSRVALAVPAAALALIAGAWVVVTPGDRSYIIGGILCVPLGVMLVPILTRDTDDYPQATEGPWGPPHI